MSYIITGYDHYGRGITKDNNKIIFVENALIDEEVEIKITNEKKNYSEAIVTNYLKKSNNRSNNICKYYDKCGGCNIMHMNYDEQLKFKQSKIENIVNKYLHEEITINDIVKSDNQFYYRNKVTFHEKNNKIGFYDKKSNNIIEIDSCMLLDNTLNNEINSTDKNHLIIRTNGNKILKDSNDKLLCQIGNTKYNLSLESFFQINNNVTKKMYDKIKEYANPTLNDIVYDLYCGVGTIGIYLADTCNKVYGIEINEKAILDAKETMKLNNLNNLVFYAGSVDKTISKIKDKPSIIVVDPPRAGLDNKTIQTILNLEPKKVVYTSCDPMTLVRDLKILSEKYIIKEITPFDMFPNTYHVENVCLLERK